MSFINFLKFRIKFLVLGPILIVIILILLWESFNQDFPISLTFGLITTLIILARFFYIESNLYKEHYQFFKDYKEADKFYQLKIEKENKKKQELNNQKRDAIVTQILDDENKKKG